MFSSPTLLFPNAFALNGDPSDKYESHKIDIFFWRPFHRYAGVPGQFGDIDAETLGTGACFKGMPAGFSPRSALVAQFAAAHA